MIFSDGEIEALCRFVESDSRALPERFNKTIRFRETIATKDVHWVVEGILCIVTLEFATRRTSEQAISTVSAYFYREWKSDILACAHRVITSPFEAPAVLSAVIEEAIHAAKANPKFRAAAQSTPPSNDNQRS